MIVGRDPSAKASAARMRLLRERRKQELIVLPVELRYAEVRHLAKLGYLPSSPDITASDVGAAIGALLDRLPPDRWPAA